MKYFTFALSFALLLGASAQARNIEPYDWHDGEALTYSVSFGVMRAGKASFVFTPNVDEETYRIRVDAQTTGLARRIFALNDTMVVEGALANFRPSRLELKLNEDDYRAHKQVLYAFDGERPMAAYSNLLQGSAPEVYEVDMATRDVISAMYFLRHTAQDVKVGSRYTLPIFSTRRPFVMDVQVVGEREFATSYGKMRLWHVVPKNSSVNEKFSAREVRPWEAWVSQDGGFVPMRIDVHLKAGTFKARLINKVGRSKIGASAEITK